MTDNKPWYASRTILAGLAIVLVELLAYLSGAGVFEGLGLSAAASETARNYAHLLSVLLGILTVYFRQGVTKTIRGSRAEKRTKSPGGRDA